MRHETYDSLEFNSVKEAVSKHCSFSLGSSYIRDEKVHFDALWIQRELQRGRDALRLYEAYRAPSFAGVKDVSQTLHDIHKNRVVNPQQLYEVALFLRAVFAFQKYKQDSALDTFMVDELVDSLRANRADVGAIEAAISSSYEVMDSASSTLKSIRNSRMQCEQRIVKETQSFMVKHADALMDSITAQRDNRTCVLVKASDKNKVKGFIHGESASGQAVYIEPEVLLNLNNTLQTLKSQETEEVYRILKELCTLLMPNAMTYLCNLDTFALLDALFAKAAWAFAHEGCYADVKEDSDLLYFKDARHPLIDERVVVSNTYRIEPPYRHLLITGSNTGGKTVTLKTIGLFTILSLAGFPILCEEAIVPCFEGVFVDIGDSQSIVESLSTFSAHISKLAHIANQASAHSLILLDELGSGTDPNEGECIAIATLNFFRTRNSMSVATTHYSKLKEYAKKQDDILLASVAFDVEKLKPTYRYLEGFSGSSNALQIAQRYHLHEDIIKEASQLKEKSKSESVALMEKLDAEKMALRNQREQLEREVSALQEERKAFVISQEKQTLSLEQSVEKAQRTAFEIIEKAKEDAHEVISTLKAMQPHVKEHEIIAAKSKLNQNEEEEEECHDHVFKEGDYVRIKTLNYHGDVLSVKGARATVFANGMKMNVKIHDLEPMNKPFIPKKSKAHVSKFSGGSRVKSECNVIGLHVEEALQTIDKYIDSALYNRVFDVRLIHGHGTGALRTAIHAYLKNNKNVSSYRLGGEGEGGMGATSVSLKRSGKNG